ncbi:MAG TPA: glycoside hydrolase family 32 protein [Candidatus Sulfotelmatobacter sp.]|nr:glycoside hydrolase family 32 protein [Candidatus Sulfotelmatobacter sp.]
MIFQALSRRDFLRFSGAAALAPAWGRFLAKDKNSDLCRKLASDPLRPQYHLLPSHNWMNDPNGPIFYQGRYHMFHQYNPNAAVWGNMHWAHATSPDMIHWKHEPAALAPTPGGPDRDGVFSGSAVLDHGKPTVIYTGVAPPRNDSEVTLRDGVHTWRETQCLAVAEDDDLRKWKKLPLPVIAAPPPGMEVLGFRDPCLWREGDRWMLILGSGIRGKGGAILLYSSPDLRRWTYLHPLVEGSPSGKSAMNPVDTGDMWECPDFFPLRDKYVLLISTMGKVHWKVGAYSSQRFTPEKEGIVDWGSYYAAKTMIDRDGNRVLWGWIPETRPDRELIAASWAGVMSLPRVLSLNAGGELQTEVAPAARQLRIPSAHIDEKTSASERQKILEAFRIRNLAAEFDLQIRPHDAGFALALQSDDGKSFAKIACSMKSGTRELHIGEIVTPISGTADSPVRLHAFLDGSVLEVFANGTTAATARVYHAITSPLRLRFENGELISLDVWQMKPISSNRLTSPLCS